MAHPSKSAWPKPCATCEAAITSVIDGIGIDDEPASIVIVGGGPHALAALSALHEGRLEDVGGPEANVCVIDPGTHFMQSWNARFDALQIDHLRSPAFTHPVAFEPTALLDFAKCEGRTQELIERPGGGDWVPTTDLSEQATLLKARPSHSLFRDFCASLEAKLCHRWLSGTAHQVCKDQSTGKFRVHFTATADGRERRVVARAVILATGPVSKWNVPTPFAPHLGASPLILHTEALLTNSTCTLSEQIARRCPEESARVLVIGGGISAAQAALAACRAGHQVVLRSRRPLQTKDFDTGSEWLDVRTGARLRFEFLCLPMVRRRELIRAATPGGSVPATYMAELLALSKRTTSLQLEVDADIDRSNVHIGGDGKRISVNGESFAMVILATGVVTSPACSELYQSIQGQFGAPTVDGLPRVDSRLRWLPGEDIFVMGANAMLELGPGGGNLMGAMRGARTVSNELRSLMQAPSTQPSLSRSVFFNMYASLGDRHRFGDGSESEIDALAQLLHLSPQAEAALRKAKKDRKATRGLKGERAPLAALHMDARTSRAAYW